MAGDSGLARKIVIDCMNPLAMRNGALGLDRGFDTSGAEALAGWIPGARVVKTLNHVGAEMMAKNADLPHRPAMFIAGDDTQAKATVSALLIDLGFEPFDAGDLTKSAPSRTLRHGLDQSGADSGQRPRLGFRGSQEEIRQ